MVLIFAVEMNVGRLINRITNKFYNKLIIFTRIFYNQVTLLLLVS